MTTMPTMATSMALLVTPSISMPMMTSITSIITSGPITPLGGEQPHA